MTGRVDRSAQCWNVVAHRGRRVDVNGEHCFDLVPGIGPKTLFEDGRVDRCAMLGRDQLDPQSVELSHLGPDGSKPSAVEHQHQVAARQRVGEGHLPSGVTVADGNEHPARRANKPRQAVEHLIDDGGEVAFVDVGHGPMHR